MTMAFTKLFCVHQVLFFNVSDGGEELAEVKDDTPDVTLAYSEGKRGGGGYEKNC